MKRNFVKMFSVAAMLAMAGLAGATNGGPAASNDVQISRKAVHEIRMYPKYSIWDNINVQVHDGALELTGQVSQPYKKADMQRLMQRVPGVVSVTNQLEVLPLSPNDDSLRLRVARSLYRDPVLSRYGAGTLPSIHVIVKNGQVTLEGVVNNENDKNVAGIRASSAGMSFGPVHNNLRVESPKAKS